MATRTDTLWIDDNGRIVCTDHAGTYLTSAIDARPDAAHHSTPLGTFVRVFAEFATELRAEIGLEDGEPLCETCRYGI